MRKAISKRLRFEVFKRDSFTCQYCGSKAPDVILNVDHIIAIKNGGKNDLLNLVTACFSCNSGKSDKKLSDNSMVVIQNKQQSIASQRTEQIKLMAKWANETIQAQELELSVIESTINAHLKSANKIVNPTFLNTELKKSLKKYGLASVLQAIQKSQVQYLDDPNDSNDRNTFLDKIPKICYWQDIEQKNPDAAELKRLAYRAKRNWYTCYPNSLFKRLSELHSAGFSIEELEASIDSSSGIMKFEDIIKGLSNV